MAARWLRVIAMFIGCFGWLALGGGLSKGLADDEDRRRMNRSAIHADLMVGSPQLDVVGVTASGEHVPVLRGGDWQV